MGSIALVFDGFGHDSLVAEAAVAGGCVTELLNVAARHYLSELDSDRFAIRAPAFARSKGTGTDMRVELDEDDFAALTSEAKRQGLAVEELLAHAALLYLADVDAGRVALAAGRNGRGLKVAQRATDASPPPVVKPVNRTLALTESLSDLERR